MSEVAVTAEAFRFPAQANEALEQGDRVLITRYGKPTRAVLSYEAYQLVAPLLELIEAGATVSPEVLMSVDDVALSQDLAADDEVSDVEAAFIDELIDRDTTDQ